MFIGQRSAMQLIWEVIDKIIWLTAMFPIKLFLSSEQ